MSPRAASRSARRPGTPHRRTRAAWCSPRSRGDALCIITNNSNPLGNITKDTIQKIFLGTDVHQLGPSTWGPDAGTIDPIGRAPTSGTHDSFRNIFLGGTNQGNFVAGKASNGLVQQGVQSDDHAIGYVSLAFTSGVHVVNYNGVACNLRNAQSFQYGGDRSFYFVTRGAPVGGAKKFINWTTHNKKANKIVATDWIPLH